MKHTSELTRAQKAYDRTVLALDRASVRETASAEKLKRAKTAHDKALEELDRAYAAICHKLPPMGLKL